MPSSQPLPQQLDASSRRCPNFSLQSSPISTRLTSHTPRLACSTPSSPPPIALSAPAILPHLSNSNPPLSCTSPRRRSRSSSQSQSQSQSPSPSLPARNAQVSHQTLSLSQPTHSRLTSSSSSPPRPSSPKLLFTPSPSPSPSSSPARTGRQKHHTSCPPLSSSFNKMTASSTSSASSSASGRNTTTHKRRRTDGSFRHASVSPASTLRAAVREALAGEISPRTKQTRLNQVYDAYRRRAIQSMRQIANKSTCSDRPSTACHHGLDDGNQQPHQAHAMSSSTNESAQLQQQHHHHEQQQNEQQQQQQHEVHHMQECEQNHEENYQHGEQIQTSTCHDTLEMSTSIKAETIPACSKSHALPNNNNNNNNFPGKGAKAGCEHYTRRCWIKAACCGRYYACRRCHDERETHEIDRHAIKQVGCVMCGDSDQPVAKQCRNCNVEFAHYFCKVCNFFDDRPGHKAYHCEGCGICRVGAGLGIDNYHCNRCGNCVPLDDKESHPCRERSLDGNCPICTEYLATSTDQVVFLRCGHCMHVDCLKKHTSTSYTCPICYKSVTDMSHWYKALDARLKQDILPMEYSNRVSSILCHDCDRKCVAKFHFVYHKCTYCAGYNTRVLHQYDLKGNDLINSVAGNHANLSNMNTTTTTRANGSAGTGTGSTGAGSTGANSSTANVTATATAGGTGGGQTM